MPFYWSKPVAWWPMQVAVVSLRCCGKPSHGALVARFLACRRMRTSTPCLTSLGQNPQAVKTSLGLPSSIKLGQYDALAAFSANPTGSGRKVYTTEVRICTQALRLQRRRPSAVGRLATDRRRRRIYKLHADRLHARHFV